MGLFDFFRKKEAIPVQPDVRQEDILAPLKPYVRPVAIACMKQGQDRDRPLASRIGGDFVMMPGETWPWVGDRPLEAVLQIDLREVPVIPEALKPYQLLTVFMDADIPDPGSEEGWEVRAYTTVAGLVAVPNPVPHPTIHPCTIRWTNASELPGGDDADTLLSPAGIAWQALYADKHAMSFYSLYNDTKLGGWPSWIQGNESEVTAHNYVLQIGSDEVTGMCWGDAGTVYLGLTDGKWVFDWQCC